MEIDFFKKKEINKYTWIRVANGRVIKRALMDYVLITKRMVGRLKDVHVFKGVAAGMYDHFLVEAEVVVAKEWGNRVVGCRREVVKVEELKKPEKKQEYQDKLKEAYDRVKEREAGELEEEWRLMKESLVGYASDVCGKRFVGGCMRRGSEWWNEGVKMKVEEKKRGLLRNGCSVTVWRSMKDIERKMWKPSERWRKQRGCQILSGDRILIGRMRRIKRSFGRR